MSDSMIACPKCDSTRDELKLRLEQIKKLMKCLTEEMFERRRLERILTMKGIDFKITEPSIDDKIPF